MDNVIDFMTTCGAFTLPVLVGIVFNFYVHQIGESFVRIDANRVYMLLDKKDEEERPMRSFFDAVLVASIVEEALCRLLPLGISLKIYGPGWQTYVVAIASCTIFGLLHTGQYGVRIALICISFGSFSFALLFLAYADMFSIWDAYIAVVAAHAAANAWNWVKT